MSKPIAYFADFAEGQQFPPFDFIISEDVLDKYLEAVGDTNEVYRIPDQNGKRIAPPSIVSLFSFSVYKNTLESPPGNLHAKQEYQNFEPLYTGDTLTVTAHIKEKFENAKGRKFLVFESEARRSGTLVSTSVMTIVWAQ